MKKVLIISTVGLIYDGITNIIMTFIENMDRKDLEFYVIGTIKIEDKIRKRLEERHCRVIEVPNRKKDLIMYFIQLIKIIKKYKIDIVHAHGNSATLVFEMMAAWIGGSKKRISHSHNTRCNNNTLDKILRPFFYLSYTEALACGKDAGNWLFRNRTFSIVENGRDIEKYRFDTENRMKIREKFGITNCTVIGHVGGFFEQKNHAFLIEIYKEIKKIDNDVVFFMIGDGPLREEIEEMGKDIDIIFVKKVDNVECYLSAMDGMLLPSKFEGLPLVALEWQINGLPSVLSDVITRDCKLTELITFMNLECSAELWAQTILEKVNGNNRKFASELSVEILKKSNFNIKNVSERLRNLYLR